MVKLVAIGENGYRVGESHASAKISDHDVELIQNLLDARNDAIETAVAAGMSQSNLQAHLYTIQLSLGWIAKKMECSKSMVKAINDGKLRNQRPVRWVRVKEKEVVK